MLGNLFNSEGRELAEVHRKIAEIDDTIARAKHKDYSIAVDALTKLREQYSHNTNCVAAIDAKRNDYEREIENERFPDDLKKIKAKLHSSRKTTEDYTTAINGLDGLIAQYPRNEETIRAEITVLKNEKSKVQAGANVEKSKNDLYREKRNLQNEIDKHKRDKIRYQKEYDSSGSSTALENFKQSSTKLALAEKGLKIVERTEEELLGMGPLEGKSIEAAISTCMLAINTIASSYELNTIPEDVQIEVEREIQEKLAQKQRKSNTVSNMSRILDGYDSNNENETESMSDEEALAEMERIRGSNTQKLSGAGREATHITESEKKIAETASANPRPSKTSLGKTENSHSNGNDSGADFIAVDPDHINVRFSDVKGLGEVEKAIRRAVVYPMTQPEAFALLNDKPGTGILMYGLPGTGKSMIAKATAKECNAKFYDIRRSDIVRSLVGDSEMRLRKLFEEARQHKHAIIFIDEFEGLGRQRGDGQTYDDSLTTEFLALMDGLNRGTDNKLLIIAASNFPGKIDEAFLRTGRLQEAIRIEPPNCEARKEIIESAYTGVVISRDIDIDKLAEEMEGYGGADVAGFCHTSKKPAHDRYAESNDSDDLEIRLEDIDYARANFRRRPAEISLSELEDFEQRLKS